MKYFLSILTLAICLKSINTSAQTLNGKIVDNYGVPLDFVTIRLNKDIDNYKIVISDSIGSFSINDLATNEKYVIEFSLVGFQKKSIAFNFYQDTTIYVTLSHLSDTLETVTVIGNKPLIERKIDRIVFNVEHSIYSKGLRAEDLLRETPRLEVSDDGQIQMIGKNGVKIMIDGRLASIDRVKSLRSDDISSIEVIPIPPSKYSAEGNSGLVNIVLKRSPNLGWQGYVTTEYTQRVYPSYYQLASVNFKSRKLDLSIRTGNFQTNILNEEKAKFSTPRNELSSAQRRNNISNAQILNGTFQYKIGDKLMLGGNYDLNLSNVKNRFSDYNIYSSPR